MKTHIDVEKFGLNTAISIQVIGVMIYVGLIAGWLWSVGHSIILTVLFTMLAVVVTLPILVYLLPAISMMLGLLACAVAWLINAIRGHHSRA